eukprot:1709815-Amphidinium_carterae.1
MESLSHCNIAILKEESLYPCNIDLECISRPTNMSTFQEVRTGFINRKMVLLMGTCDRCQLYGYTHPK